MNKKKFLIRLFIVLFTVSVSAAVIPCGIINVYGLFGEIKPSAVTQESKPVEQHTESIFQTRSRENEIKRINIFNIYNAGLYIVIIILSLVFALMLSSLPSQDTLVTFKVRMNN